MIYYSTSTSTKTVDMFYFVNRRGSAKKLARTVLIAMQGRFPDSGHPTPAEERIIHDLLLWCRRAKTRNAYIDDFIVCCLNDCKIIKVQADFVSFNHLRS